MIRTIALFFLTVAVCIVLAGCVFSYKPSIEGSTVHTNSNTSTSLGKDDNAKDY